MKLPILIALPHGETCLPIATREQLTLSTEQIQKYYWDYGSKEIFTHDKFHILSAKYSRLFCDLNRASNDWTLSKNFKRAGIVRQKTEYGKEIYMTPLTDSEKISREKEHKEFYARCLQIIKNENIQFFIAGHTMEDLSLDEEVDPKSKRPDIVLSTNNFRTCNKKTAFLFSEIFQSLGFSVQIDDPFLGGHLLTHFCSKKTLPGVQIEVRRGLFSTNAENINGEQLTAVSQKIERAISLFWKKFLTESKR